jgi:hypothetical protein
MYYCSMTLGSDAYLWHRPKNLLLMRFCGMIKDLNYRIKIKGVAQTMVWAILRFEDLGVTV